MKSFAPAMTGRILDPVFLSMIGAVALAVMASIAVRAMAGARPAQAMQRQPIPPSNWHPQVQKETRQPGKSSLVASLPFCLVAFP